MKLIINYQLWMNRYLNDELIMNIENIIVGVDRSLSNLGEGSTWNRKRLEWIVTNNRGDGAVQYVIWLDMTILSSERVVYVNN